MHNNIESYIQKDYTEQLPYLVRQVPLFKQVEKMAQTQSLSNEQIQALAQLLKSFSCRFTNYEKALEKYISGFDVCLQTLKGVKYTYEQLIDLGFPITEADLHFESPMTHLNSLAEQKRWVHRGLSYNEKGKIQLNANTFARYVMERIDLVQDDKANVYYYNGAGLYTRLPDNLLKSICKHILDEAGGGFIWKRMYETEYISVLKNDCPYEFHFDSDKNLINFSNGYFDLSTMKLTEHTAKYRTRFQLPYAYNCHATCPQFVEFLNSVFEEDQERVNLIQELLGYLWIKEVKIHKAFIFLGKGSNGKSVLAKVIRQLLGIEQVSSVGLKNLQQKFGLQEFPNKLANISSENEFSEEFTTENFKLVTGGDSISVEKKHQDSNTVTLFIKLIILLNKMMDCKDTSDGFIRRLVIIPFNQKYVELREGEQRNEEVEYMDLELEHKLLNELPGIFNFAMEGLTRLRQNGFKLTASKMCDDALDTYVRSQNPVIDYFNQKVIRCDKHKMLRSSVYEHFLSWCKTNRLSGNRIPSRTHFVDEIKRLALSKGISIREPKIQGFIYFEGIQLI